MRRRMPVIAAVLLVCFFVSGCQGASSDGKSSEPKTVNWATSADIITLDACKSEDNMSGEVLYHVCEPLRRSVGGVFQPGVAESYDIAPDGLTYTYRLRQSTWSDGKPVTAQHFVDAIVRILDPKTATANANSHYPIKNAEKFNKGEVTDASQLGVKAPDEKTLVVTLDYASPPFFDIVSATMPIRMDVVERHGESYGSEASKFIGNGPFKMASWTHNVAVEMVKNETYWNAKAVKLDGLNRMVVQDANTRVSMYDTGEANFATSIPTAFEKNYDNLRAIRSGAVVALEFNVNGMTPETGKVISNVNFRKALSYAVDRTALAKAVQGSSWAPATRVLSDSHAGVSGRYHEEQPVENTLPVTADPAKAKEYLETALQELNTTVDKLPEITFLLFEVPTYKLFSETLVDTWKQTLGLECVKITQLPIPQCIQTGMQRKFDIYFQGIGGTRDPYANLEYWTTNGAINWTGWSDPKYDEMVAATNTYTDPVRRFAKIAECEKHLLENGPIEPLFYSGSSFVYRDDVITGVTFEAFGCNFQFVYADMVR